jgi:hypothetical protein
LHYWPDIKPDLIVHGDMGSADRCKEHPWHEYVFDVLRASCLDFSERSNRSAFPPIIAGAISPALEGLSSLIDAPDNHDRV